MAATTGYEDTIFFADLAEMQPRRIWGFKVDRGSATGEFSKSVEPVPSSNINNLIMSLDSKYIIPKEFCEAQVDQIYFPVMLVNTATICETNLGHYQMPSNWLSPVKFALQTLFIGHRPKISDIKKDYDVQDVKKAEMITKSISREIFIEIERQNIKTDIYAFLSILVNTYRNLHNIMVGLEQDPEIENHFSFSVNLTVSGTPEDVLTDEMCFRERVHSKISRRSESILTIAYDWKS